MKSMLDLTGSQKGIIYFLKIHFIHFVWINRKFQSAAKQVSPKSTLHSHEEEIIHFKQEFVKVHLANKSPLIRCSYLT